jgi:hypothetical protein
MRLILTMTPIAVLAVGEFAVDQNFLNLVLAFAATVGLVIAVIRWIDKRIDHKIRNYAQLVTLQHKRLLREISVLREVFGHEPLKDEPDDFPEPSDVKKGA